MASHRIDEWQLCGSFLLERRPSYLSNSKTGHDAFDLGSAV
jgi:hypothetical protein